MNHQTISDIIKDLAAKNGGHITPAEIVEHAKKKNSPLHDQFDWNDKSAAYKNRLDTARELIRVCRIEFHDSTTTISSCAAFVRDPELDSKQQGYVSIEKLKSNKDLAREALVAKFSRIATELRNAHELSTALGINDEVEEIEKRITGISEFIQEPAST